MAMTETDQRAQTADEGGKQPGLRFLEATVYIMGGLLVLMLVALLGGLAWKLTHKAPAAAPPVESLDIAIPPGSNVIGMTLDGDRMAVHVLDGAVDHEIIIVDTRKGAVVSRVRLKPAASSGK